MAKKSELKARIKELEAENREKQRELEERYAGGMEYNKRIASLVAEVTELKAENITLRILADMFDQALYSVLPYRHYWYPYVYIGPVTTCKPDWTYRPENDIWTVSGGANTYVSGDTSKYRCTLGVDSSDVAVTSTGYWIVN